jgi:hypothetical protein
LRIVSKEGALTRLVIITIGSRGDVQPYIALGVGSTAIPCAKLTADALAHALMQATQNVGV